MYEVSRVLHHFVAQTSLSMKVVSSDAEAFSLLAISIVIIATRLAARISTIGLKKLQSDDFMMVLAGVHLPPVFLQKRRRS